MLLLTDGSVLVHDEPVTSTVAGSNRWFRLQPDSHGSYTNGTWTQLQQGPNSPLYFACSVLRDGRVFIAGGEYNGTPVQVWLAAAEIYDPVANTWTDIGVPSGWTRIGDAPSAVLPDGRVLLGDDYGTRTAFYDPVANSWAAGPSKSDPNSDEETWVLLGDSTVLAIECTARPATEKYVLATNTWVSAGSTPVALVDGASLEVGSALLLPDGRVFAIGATSNTALYSPPLIASQPGTWSAGPTFPVLTMGMTTGAKDAPACLLPNGRVLCLVAPYSGGSWGSPLTCFEFDPANNDTLAQVDAPPNDGLSPYYSRLMLLPDGTVLHTNSTSTIGLYTPDGAPDPAWRPTITSAPNLVIPGNSYTLKGRQINGLSQAVIYGDEGAMATNYPIVRLTHVASGTVTYCRTHDHSTMGVQTGTVIHSTTFDVPAGTPTGPTHLCVIANGIASVDQGIAVGLHKLKEGKELKAEIKEHLKVEIKEHLKVEIKEHPEKVVFDNFNKLTEGDDLGFGGGDESGWLAALRLLAMRGDALQAEVEQLRTFVRRGERPDVAPPVAKVAFDKAPLARPRTATEDAAHLPPGSRRKSATRQTR
jgi:hypothetical protein